MSIQNITGGSINSFTPDVLTQLKDAGAVTTTARDQVGGADRTLDFGGLAPGTLVEQVAYTRGQLVVDVSAMDFTTGDETAQILLLLSDNASGGGTGFAAGDNVRVKASIPLGDLTTLLNVANMDDTTATTSVGRHVIGVSNEWNGALLRFMATAHVVGGTTPSINYQAWFVQEYPV